MNLQDIVSKLKSLDLPDGNYVVYGSGPMAAAGIRETNDIDLLISEAIVDNLKATGWKQVTKSENLKPYVKDDFEAYTSWAASSYRPSLRQLLATATYIDNIPFASIYEVKKWKESFGRAKDKDDLKLINKFLSSKDRPKATITICSSANFYKQVIELQEKLEAKGYRVLIPAVAKLMKKSGDFEVSHYKTWYANKDDYYKKIALMRGHFNEVERGDAILVVNNEKHGITNYIGGNVLMEMSLAFWFRKPVFILNDIPEESSFIEEIVGLNPVVLHGNLDDLEI